MPFLAGPNLSKTGLSTAAEELLKMLRTVGGAGWTRSLRKGDTGVGYTMWAPSSGKQDNKGFLFRMKKNKLEMLFGKPKVFDLTKPDEI